MRARSQGPNGLSAPWLYRIMRQGNIQPRAKLDAIADSMTNIAIRGSQNPTDSAYIYAREALNALVSFGTKDLPGTPYDGVTDRLIRVAREGSNSMDKLAVYSLTEAPDYSGALQYLRVVAADPGTLATAAIFALSYATQNTFGRQKSTNEREQATAVLRELFVSKSVKNAAAAEIMSSIARWHNWR